MRKTPLEECVWKRYFLAIIYKRERQNYEKYACRPRIIFLHVHHTFSPHISTSHAMNQSHYDIAKNSVAWCAYPLDTVLGRGKDMLDLLQRLTTNDVTKLANPVNISSPEQVSLQSEGVGVQNILLTDKARIIDVFTILARPEAAQNGTSPAYLQMLFSAGFGAKAAAWLDKYTFIEDAVAQDGSPEYASILIFGARSQQLLEELTGLKLQDFRHNAWKDALLSSIPCTIIKQAPLCGYCYVLHFPRAVEASVYELLRGLSENAENGVCEIDAETFETLRIEAAWGKHGAEWTDERNPLEAGLVGLVDFKKGCYIGQEVIARLDTYNKVKVRLSGVVSDKAIPPNARFFDETDGKRTDIGGVTSSTYSPELQKYIALGYIRTAFANPGASIDAALEDGTSGYAERLEIVKLPFVM